MKIWHISDTHSFHKLLTVPGGIDMIIHSGDFSNYFDVFKNEPETREFIQWYGGLNIKYKVLIAGNHDAMAAKWTKEFKKLCKHYNIIYLENEEVIIEGIKIFGTPIQPSFGNWYFQKSRDKLDKFWYNIPEDTDVLVVHGPPRGVLDLSYNKLGNVLEFCGCKALKRHVIHRLNLKMCLFGHIHNAKDIINQGTLQLTGKDTIFSNGSVVTDGKFGTLSSNGNILDYKI
jgi:Icc-related predicted phosphoesterase